MKVAQIKRAKRLRKKTKQRLAAEVIDQNQRDLRVMLDGIIRANPPTLRKKPVSI